MCCSVGFARSLGLALLPLALCCIVANLLLLFPMGEIDYVQQDRLASYIWYFGGLGGGGLLVSKKLDLCSNWKMKTSVSLVRLVKISGCGGISTGVIFKKKDNQKTPKKDTTKTTLNPTVFSFFFYHNQSSRSRF